MYSMAHLLLGFGFPAYLQGMETRLRLVGREVGAGFPAYLQGMETGVEDVSDTTVLKCSQPTYKEWKLGENDFCNGWATPVPSLPTRNGNHLSYTTRHPPVNVPSLPTRNGNVLALFAHTSHRSRVPSLPTRNGNGPEGFEPLA